MKRYIIRDHEAGNVISDHTTIEEAKKELNTFIDDDKKDGNYEEDFYEIYDLKNEEVVYIA